jgi:Raf kinase inhibitor-like YbhB/YbcL family protein
MKTFNLILGTLILSTSSFASSFQLSSSVIQANKNISVEQTLNGFGCSGANLSPDLKWSGAPKETKAFALTVFDKDAPTGSGWWHWVVINIPSSQTTIELGASGKLALSGALETRTDFGKPGYGGPCPPAGSGAHRYIFKVYALKDKIPLDAEASGAMVGFYISNLKIAEATLQAKYGRE